MSLNIHIGQLVSQEMKRQGRTATWLASQIPTNRTNVYAILRRRNIDPELLMRLSEILGHNFFSDLSIEAEQRIACLKM